MNALGLSPAQLVERQKRLHAGDADAIMRGDYRTPYRRIKGLDPEADLSGEFRVQLGSYTEPFNLAWAMRETGRPIRYYSANPLMQKIWDSLIEDGDIAAFHQELVVCKRYPFMAANLDGMTTTPQGHRCVIDAKHVAQAGDTAILRYTPAGVWQATCAGTDWWALSFIVGNKWGGVDYQEVDPMYQADMIARATECWGYIERCEEPPEAPAEPVLPPKPQPRLRTLHVPTEPGEVYDAMCRVENWLPEAVGHIKAIIATDAAAKVNAIHRDGMKTLLPEDVGIVEFGRYKAHRDRAGAVRQTVAKLGDDE